MIPIGHISTLVVDGTRSIDSGDLQAGVPIKSKSDEDRFYPGILQYESPKSMIFKIRNPF